MPPGASPVARALALRVKAPVENILHQQTSSGFVLLAMAVIAFAWANSPWSDSYSELWHTDIAIGIGSWTFSKSLHFWINDFLMTFFFMVAGFEIKREMAEGELSDLRRASLPVGAAIGGMMVPALIYVAFNPSGALVHGWGVPMATDIAFALGIMVLLGDRISAAMRILLLALAIIDDLGAILVIALFYSSNFAVDGLLVVGVGLLVLLLFRRIGVRPGGIYFVPLMIIWAGLYQAGVHPTIAGVIVGLSAPVKPWLSREQFLIIANGSLEQFNQMTAAGERNEDKLLEPLNRLTLAGREAIAPVVRLQNAFHTWVAFFIMPVFALANAGVSLSGLDFGAPTAMPVMLGISLGLLLGKPIGVLLVSWLMVRMGWSALPRGVTWGGMTVIGLCAGIGFTMAIFIAELAFRPSVMGDASVLALGKLSILIATASAATIALLLGRIILPRISPDVAAKTPADAEASTEY